MLPGKTYSTRLWCVIEVYTFVQMGGAKENMPVRPLIHDDDTLDGLVTFDAGKAQCFKPEDRQRLYAVIEASFGAFEPFNKLVRDMFVNELGITQKEDSIRLASSAAAAATLSLVVDSAEKVAKVAEATKAKIAAAAEETAARTIQSHRRRQEATKQATRMRQAVEAGKEHV